MGEAQSALWGSRNPAHVHGTATHNLWTGGQPRRSKEGSTGATQRYEV